MNKTCLECQKPIYSEDDEQEKIVIINNIAWHVNCVIYAGEIERKYVK